MKPKRIKTHPGAVLREDYMEKLGLSAQELGRRLDVPHSRVLGISNETESLTPDIAVKLARLFNTTPEFWLNLQAAHDRTRDAAKTD